ncbi:MAG: DUF2029 domain-containing protein ['Candidatus Kapabacteria' thiocyanatum]|nr:DUF2029 domain-containing protein ['Candidatus Kapabacteria' thiocyanatum]
MAGLLTMLCIASVSGPLTDSTRMQLTDLPTFQAAAIALAHDENPYDHAVLVKTMTVPHGRFRIYPYVYTPLLAAMLGPVASLSTAHLQTAWLLALCAAAGMLVTLSLRLLRESSFAGARVAVWMASRPPWQELLLAVGILVVMPFHTAFMNGQIEAVTALGVVGTLLLLAHGRTIPAGILFAAVLVTKHASIVLVLYFVIRGEWRFIGIVAIAAVVMVLGSTFLIGVRPWLDFLAFVRTFDAATAASWNLPVDGSYNLSIPGLLSRMVIPASTAMKTLPLVLVLALGTVVWVFRRTLAGLTPALVYAAVALSASLIMPYTWSHHTLYALPGIVVLCVLPVTGRMTNAYRLLLPCAVALIFWSIPGMMIDGHLRGLLGLTSAAPMATFVTTGMVGLTVLCIIVALRQQTSTIPLPS